MKAQHVNGKMEIIPYLVQDTEQECHAQRKIENLIVLIMLLN